MINGKQAAAVALVMIIAIPILMGYAFASEQVTKTETTVDYTRSLTDTLLNSETYYYNDYGGPENNSSLLKYASGSYTFTRPDYVVTSTAESSIPMGVQASRVVTLTADEYNDLSSFDYADYTFETVRSTALRMTFADGDIQTVGGSGLTVIRAGSYLLYKEAGNSPIITYAMVSKLEVMSADESLTLHYYSSGNSTYADPSYGWAMPDTTYQYFWTNGYSNYSVTFLMHMDTPGSDTTTAALTPYLHSPVSFTLDSYGLMTIDYSGTTYTLGHYNDVQIVYTVGKSQDNLGSCTVTGIPGWPSMGYDVSGSNSVTFDLEEQYEFSLIEIESEASTIWRCDSASVVAGTFPVTKNYALDLINLYPGKNCNLKLNSIGIYGDYITVANETYYVTDNSITVDDETVKLKGAVFQIVRQGQFWAITVNNVSLGVVSVQQTPTITFGGIWSLTATAEILKTETVTVEEWAPGQFAFDKDTFILVMIFVAVAMFIALGFTAGRSGGKVLALAVACGGAAVIALILV